MKRSRALERIHASKTPFHVVVIGGGASGLGAAVDAASRGHSVALFEEDDFAKGTSSRSTKLVHGGVRYLQQGNISLVLEALRERGRLAKNAPASIEAAPEVARLLAQELGRDEAWQKDQVAAYAALEHRA